MILQLAGVKCEAIKLDTVIEMETCWFANLCLPSSVPLPRHACAILAFVSGGHLRGPRLLMNNSMRQTGRRHSAATASATTAISALVGAEAHSNLLDEKAPNMGRALSAPMHSGQYRYMLRRVEMSGPRRRGAFCRTAENRHHHGYCGASFRRHERLVSVHNCPGKTRYRTGPVCLVAAKCECGYSQLSNC